MKNYIISEKRLIELLKDEELLYRLETAGVDNWIGYEDAIEGSINGFEETYEDFCDKSNEELTKSYPRFEHPLIIK